MRPAIKFSGGILFMLLGIAGFVFSGFVIYQIRIAASSIEQEMPRNLGHIEQVAHSVHQQGEATGKVIETTRERLSFLGGTITSLSSKLKGRAQTPSVIVSLDEDVDNQLNNAKQFVHSMQNSMRNLGNTLLLFDSMSFLGSPRFGGPSPRVEEEDGEANPIHSVAVSLTKTADLLDEVTKAISKLQTGESIHPTQLDRIQTTLDRVDQELVAIQSEVNSFSKEVAETEGKLSTLKQESPAVVRYLANMSCLFLLCFGGTQFLVFCVGFHWAKQAYQSRTDLKNTA